MTASTRAILPPGTAIRETANILVTLIEAERAATLQKAEAGFIDLLEHQNRETLQLRKRFESETAAYEQRIRELEAQNAGLLAQLQGEMGPSQALNNITAIFCETSQGTVDPRNLMKVPSEPKPPSSLEQKLLPTSSFEKFGVLVEKDTIVFQGYWVNFWKELATAESATEDLDTAGPMTLADLERLLTTSIDNVRRNKEERDSLAQSVMGAYTQF